MTFINKQTGNTVKVEKPEVIAMMQKSNIYKVAVAESPKRGRKKTNSDDNK